jgi:hypothetical protein
MLASSAPREKRLKWRKFAEGFPRRTPSKNPMEGFFEVLNLPRSSGVLSRLVLRNLTTSLVDTAHATLRLDNGIAEITVYSSSHNGKLLIAKHVWQESEDITILAFAFGRHHLRAFADRRLSGTTYLLLAGS